MKRLSILLTIFTMSLKVVACSCLEITLAQALNSADKVFTGRIIGLRSSSNVYVSIAVSQVFKGAKVDTFEIQTGMGHGDCGAPFELGKSYLIFSKSNYTSVCSGTAPVQTSTFLEKLKFIYEKGYAKNLGQTTDLVLTDSEAVYLNGELFFDRSKFDFHNKKVAFVSGSSASTIIDKKQYFSNWGGKDVANSLLVLTEKEKIKSGGFDAVVVSWSKIKISNRSKKRLLAKLKKSLQ